MQPKHDDRRRGRRKYGKRKTVIACRKGLNGLGADLAISMIDLCDEGVSLVVKEWINPKTDVEVTFSGLGMNKPLVTTGLVKWCNPMEKGFHIGVQLHEPISYSDIGHLV